MKDLGYILKRVIIGTLIALLVMFIKNNVFALTCASGTTYAAQYYNNSTWTGFTANPFTSIPYTATLIRTYFYNSNINNNHITFTGRINLTSQGGFDANPTFSYYYGSSTTITNYCTTLITRSYTYDDGLRTSTLWQVSYSCDYTGSSTSNNNVRIQIDISSLPIYRFYTDSRCMQITPSDKDQIINNDNSNTLDIMQDMYNYYSSLWDKSNVSEQIILSEIDSQSQDIQDKLNDISDQIDDLEINYSTPSSNDLEGFQENMIEQFEGIDDQEVDFHGFIIDFFDNFKSLFTSSDTCQPITLPFLYNNDLVIPCISIPSYIGQYLWGAYDVLCCGIALFFISKSIIKVVGAWTTMEEGDPIE